MKWLLLVLTLFFGAKPALATSELIEGVSLTVSSEAQGYPGTQAVDGNRNTFWKITNEADHWISIDLKANQTINKLILIPQQSKKDRTVHRIEVGPSMNQLKKLIILDQLTENNKIIEIPLLAPVNNVRFIKITSLKNSSWKGWREVQVFKGNTSEQHLKFFGYMSTDSISDASSVESYFRELELLNNTNIAWAKLDRLERYKKLGIKVLMADTRWSFFNGSELKDGWQQKWEAYAEKLQPYKDIIYGFYFDEPVHNGFSKNAFVTATKTIRETFPDKAIMVIEARPPIDEDRIPTDYYNYVTDIGFDFYPTLHAGDYEDNWEKYLRIAEKFEKFSTQKKYWLIPDGYASGLERTTLWKENFERYLSLAMTTQNSVGIMPFIYNAPEGQNMKYDLKEMIDPSGIIFNQEFRNRQIFVGRKIITNNVVPTSTPRPTVDITTKPTQLPTVTVNPLKGDYNNDGKVNIQDYLWWKEEYTKNPTTEMFWGYQTWKEEYVKTLKTI